MYRALQEVEYRRPKVGWVKAVVVEVTRKDLVLKVEGNPLLTKIALKHLKGDNSPVR